MGEDHRGIEVAIVHLVVADAAEELYPVNVNRDGMRGRGGIAIGSAGVFITCELRCVGRGVELAGDGGTSDTCEQSRRGVLTDAALDELVRRLPADGCAAEGADFEAALKISKRIWSEFRSDLQQMRATTIKFNRISNITISMIENIRSIIVGIRIRVRTRGERRVLL